MPREHNDVWCGFGPQTTCADCLAAFAETEHRHLPAPPPPKPFDRQTAERLAATFHAFPDLFPLQLTPEEIGELIAEAVSNG